MQEVLDSDVYKADKKTVSVEKIITKLWEGVQSKNFDKLKSYIDLLM